MKRQHRVAWILVALLIFLQTSPVKSFSSPEVTPLIQEEEEELSLELSPIDPDFSEDSGEDDLQVSPLTIEQAARGVSARSILPAQFDLRDYRRVSPVKDQGQNGSCWAFAAYGSMESYMSQFGSYDFSEKHLRNMHGFDWTPDQGGNRDIATAYFARWAGPIKESDDPYDPYITVSPSKVERALDIEQVIYLPDVTNAYETDQIKWAIMEYGGVYTTINSSKYYDNPKTFSHYNPGAGKADHAVTIVGWDDSFSSSAFSSRPPGNGAWIVKNSWGSKYMDQGYYYVSYYDKFCGRSNAVFVPKRKDPKGKIYQYDPLGATRSVGYNQQGYMANVFRSIQEETLYEVGLFNVAANTSYKVYLVRDVESTDDLNVKREEIASGTMTLPGYYTIDTKEVSLKTNEQFAIVVHLDSSSTGYRFPMAIEMPIPGYSSQAVAQPGQSYVSANGESWKDLNREIPNTNACIKAITTTGEVLDSSEMPDITPIDPEPYPHKISFKEGSLGYMYLEDKGQLTPLIEPAELSDIPLEWTSSDKDVAVVVDGVIYPIEVGNVNILAKTEDGRLEARFNLQVVPEGIRVPDREMIPIIGKNDYEPPVEPEPEPEPEDPKPDPPAPELDPSLPRQLNINIPELVIEEGKKFNLDSRVFLYPETADRSFTYTVKDEGLLTIDEAGMITGLAAGKTRITVRTHNGLEKSIPVRVVPDNSQRLYEIVSIEHGKRTAGVFTLKVKADMNGRGYTGPAKILLESDERYRLDTIYFYNGIASITYNGFQFGVWRKNFKATVSLQNVKEEYRFNY